MNKNFGLGRGLDSLIPRMNPQAGFSQSEETQELVTDNGERVILVSPFEIEANPFQPRKEFDEARLKDLADSIKQYGVLQPLV
ncbi:MAG: ParB N-terminal domain-containing protein, partial [Patescibacteria group bacterium]